MAKMISESAFLEIAEYCIGGLERTTALRMFEELAIEIKPLIRCKDCAYNGTVDCAMHFGDCQWNKRTDYCSWAKPKG